MRWLVIIIIAFVSCGGTKTAAVTVEPLPSATTTPKPVALPAPTVQAFIDAGCKVAGDASLLDCTGASIPGIAKCRMPLHVLPVSLEPPAVVAECFVQGATGGLRQTGCMIASAVGLVLATPTGFVTIDTREELAKTFAPVTSEKEAAAFAVTTTGAAWVESASFGRSESQPDGDGWRVRLFNHQVCGCSHPTWSIDYAVTRQGAVTEITRKVVFEDPKMRGLCVD